MENIRRKNKMIETYSILLIDILGVVLSYALSLFIRFRIIHYENYPRQFHLMVGTYIVVLCLLYNMFLDANRNFFYQRLLSGVLLYSTIYTDSCCGISGSVVSYTTII